MAHDGSALRASVNGRPVSDRFKVTSITGFTLDTNSTERTQWQVLDTAYCHGLVYETYSESQARMIADDLNRDKIKTLNRAKRNRRNNARGRAAR